jgi:hypothetical protein
MSRIVYSGVYDELRNQSKIGEWMLRQSGVKLEGIWTGYSSGSTVTVSTNLVPCINPFVVATVCSDAGYSVYSGATLNGVGMAAYVNTNSGGGSGGQIAAIFGIIPGSFGSQNFSATATEGAIVGRAIVYEFSGVDQSNPVVNANVAYASSTTSVSTTIATDPYGMSVDVCLSDQNYNLTPASSQTEIPVNGINSGGYYTNNGTSLTAVYNYGTATKITVGAIGLRAS